MATDGVLRKGNDYQTYFDPKAYCDLYYTEVEGPVFIQFVVESLHKIYKTGTIKGKCLLEIGTGPCIHMVIPAAKWFDEILLSDFSPANCDIVNKWINGNKDGHNWDPFFKYYSKLQGNKNSYTFVSIIGTIKGKCLLEIGTGPCIHMVIPAAKWFDEILLSDFSPANCDIVNKWINGNKDGHNWDPFFKYYSKLQGNKGWHDMETDLRNKVKKMLPCDVHLPNPVNPVVLSNLDAICTSLCLESASPDIASYRQAMKNVVAMLKPGGKFILMGVVQSEFYTVGSEKFYSLSLTKEDILDAIVSCGMNTLEVFEDGKRIEGDMALLNEAVLILAEKQM